MMLLFNQTVVIQEDSRMERSMVSVFTTIMIKASQEIVATVIILLHGKPTTTMSAFGANNSTVVAGD